ncbi:MAG: DNA translocase FtsK [Terracidiphilus sp.]|jgi:S-DNA-T family DNA segregation ATPase FtsK/SpoIIIE
MKPIRIVLSPTRSRPLNIFLGLMLVLAALLLLLALATYHSSDPSLNTASGEAGPHAVGNWIGPFGASLSDLLLQWIGITVFFMPLWLGGLGWTWMRSRPGGAPWLRWIGTALTLVFFPAVLGLLPWRWLWLHAVPVEGVLGKLMAGLLVRYLNIQGAWLVAGVLAAAGLWFASAISFSVIAETLLARWFNIVSLHDRWRNWREERADLREERIAEREALRVLESQPEVSPKLNPQQLSLAAMPDTDSAETEGSFDARPSLFARLFRRRRAPEIDPQDIPAFQRAIPQAEDENASADPVHRPSIWDRASTAPAQPAASPVVNPVADSAPDPAAIPITPLARTTPPAPPQPIEPRPGATRFEPAAPPPAFEPSAAAPRTGEIAIHGRADAELHTATVAPKNVSGFALPPSTLLNTGDGPLAVREDELREEARVLVEKCGEFDVRGQVVQINPGPMVTTYEFKPEAGVKYSRVTGLADDLCLAMRAESILIERMPGKNTVGIQVPNHRRETIHLRECIEAEAFHKAKSRLTIAMGKDINGRIITADLAAMPHVLIAGSTGSGKSVAINAMIMSLLYRTTPAQVRLILVDPKRVELGMYEGVPHLFTPIITEPKLAANALRNAVREMERRLKLLASRSVRNIDQYNKLFDSNMPSLFEDAVDEEPLPYIVIIIDELADLMMLDRANVEESITRLAQMARAVGIHLILATQRPSVDVITGLIKANVPTRISFRLATKVDSRTILDTNGAEALLGRGDMLFLPPGTSRLMRLHAPYVSEKETAAVVGFWKDQGQAEYVEGFLESPKDERASVDGSNPDPDENDPLFDDAVRLVFEFGKASTSLLQRRLRIGYGRAAHLIDLMERDGLVGQADGSRPRELLKAPGWLHEVSSTANE